MISNFEKYLKANAGVTDEQFKTLSEGLKLRSVKQNEFLLRTGEICRNAFFVERGLLRSYSIDKNGKEHIVQFAPENWFISDRSSAYFNEPSEYFIDAIEESSVIFLDNDFIRDATEMIPSFRKYNEYILHNHIRHLYKRINILISDSAESRYLIFVRMYPDLLLRVPQWMVASYLGIAPESLSRIRLELAKRNFKSG